MLSLILFAALSAPPPAAADAKQLIANSCEVIGQSLFRAGQVAYDFKRELTEHKAPLPTEQPILSAEVDAPKERFHDYGDSVWMATEFPLLKVEERKWIHTIPNWGIQAGDIGLAAHFKIPVPAMANVPLRYDVVTNSRSIGSAYLAGIYVRDWSLVTCSDLEDYLVASYQKRPAKNYFPSVWPCKDNVQPMVREHNEHMAPGCFRLEWERMPAGERQIVALLHWRGRGGLNPSQMALAIKDGKALRVWLYSLTQKRDLRDMPIK